MQRQFDELKLTGRLPSPSGVGLAILRLTSTDDFSQEDIVKTIQSDPALTGRVLKMANGAKSATVDSITTVSEATIRLGVRTVRNVALGFSLISAHRDGACEAFDYETYWSGSLARAVAAQHFSNHLSVSVPAECYVSSLLGGIGRLALASVHPERYGQILQQEEARHTSGLMRLERQAFEIDHLEVVQALLDDWGLPEFYGQAITLAESRPNPNEEQDGPVSEMVTALRAAARFARLCLVGDQDTEAIWCDLKALCEDIGWTEDELVRNGEAMRREWQDWGETLEIATEEVPPLAGLAQQHACSPAAAIEIAPEEIVDERQSEDLYGEEEELATEGPTTSDLESATQTLRVLAIDDDPVSLRLLTLMMQRAGHEVLSAPDGESGLKLALEFGPQVVITDWLMPGMDGLDLCQALRRFESGRQIYVIVLTGREEEDRIVEAFDAGVDDYVIKPFNPKVMMARVRAAARVVQLQQQVTRDRKMVREQVAKLAVLNRKLTEASLTDPLTGLSNRRYAMDTLQKEWKKHVEQGTPLSLIMCDIDHFKQVNDRFGHDAGDEVLRETARVFNESTRKDESACRLGGEEFLVICPATDAEGARMCAERLRQAIEANHVTFGELDGNVTVSLGVASVVPDMEHHDDLLKAADLAVYEAKDAGRNRVCVAEPQPVA